MMHAGHVIQTNEYRIYILGFSVAVLQFSFIEDSKLYIYI